MERELPDDVIDFIYQFVETIDVLDVLIRLASEPGRSWTGRQMAQALGCPITKASDLLAAVHFRGFTAVANGSYRYSVADEARRRAIDAFVAAYRRRPAAVVREIASLGGPRSFADAFRLRKKGEDHG
ncbi:MAG: hypothetical protein HYR85_19320 [Planctomycetes bacterium]|nr:hypothetical protein [Planctomycetota bacterium]MBI3843740.1 hypothetical protein [Planctomycetota bacterium]